MTDSIRNDGVTFKDRILELVRETGHIGIARDIAVSERIPETEQCKRCHGTGNELYAMYRRCQACNGDGRSRGNEHEFQD